MHPLDSGPIYRETLMGRIPVEPWNTWSNGVFLALVLFWAWRVFARPKDHRFLVFVLPVLFLGFVGGTVFHGTRSHELWLLMDWVPIVMLCIACMAMFARRAGLSWWALGPLLALPFVVRFFMFRVWHVPPAIGMNVGYGVLGLAVLLPIVLHVRRNHWRNAGWMVASACCFALAVTFRSLDHSPVMGWLPMGTHWLWHGLGGVAVHFLIGYIWRDDRIRSATPPAIAAVVRMG